MGDCEVRTLKMPLHLGPIFRVFALGLFKPRYPTVLGQEFSGVVEKAGDQVTKFKVGDAVFGTKWMPFGTYAEYAAVSIETVYLKPAFLTFPQAAALPIGASESIHFLNLVGIIKGSRVLVIGAGGSIGTYAVQYAKYLGAAVTGVDHPDKLDLLREIGCNSVVDYTVTDLSTLEAKFDVVYDGAAKSTTSIMKNCLAKNGKIIIGTPSWGQLFRSLVDPSIVLKFADKHDSNIKIALDMCEKGIMRPIIDSNRFTLDNIDKGHEYAESGLKRGNIVVDVFE